MDSENRFDELRFFAEVKRRPGMFLRKTSLISLRDYIFGMYYVFDIYACENQFEYFGSFTDWYFENVVRDQNGYACWWNHFLYVSGNNDDLAFHNFFREFEKYLKNYHDLCLPELEQKGD